MASSWSLGSSRIRSSGHPASFSSRPGASRKETVGGLDAGADDYLAKPFDPTELVARVRAAERLHRGISRSGRKERGAGHDLAAASETQEELIQAGKMAAVGTLISGLSHELNNPVAIILMKVQLLLRQQRGEGPDRGRGAHEGPQHHRGAGEPLLQPGARVFAHSRAANPARESCDLAIRN